MQCIKHSSHRAVHCILSHKIHHTMTVNRQYTIPFWRETHPRNFTPFAQIFYFPIENRHLYSKYETFWHIQTGTKPGKRETCLSTKRVHIFLLQLKQSKIDSACFSAPLQNHALPPLLNYGLAQPYCVQNMPRANPSNLKEKGRSLSISILAASKEESLKKKGSCSTKGVHHIVPVLS